MAQVLPKDESFAAPDWTNPSSGTQSSPPWYFYYVGFNPSINFSTSATDAGGTPYPMRPGGDMGGSGTSALLGPDPGSLTSLPCIMVDPNGFSAEDVMRSVLLREETSFSHDDQDITATFMIEREGGSSFGYSSAGTNGSSPQPGGRFAFPGTTAPTTNLHRNMAPTGRGNWTTGGAMAAMNSDAAPINMWPAWSGNAIYFRAGSGKPTAVDGALPASDTSKRLWYYKAVNHYAFCAYPSGTVTDPTLNVELWQCTYTDATSTSGNTARLLIKQPCLGCVDRIDFSQPFTMRVKIENDSSGAPGPYPEIQAFIGPYTDLNGVVQEEVQCFTDNVLDTNNDYSVGTDVTHTAASGVVSDRHSSKINTFADQTIGFATSCEQLKAVNVELDETATAIWQVHTGLYSLESKSIPSSGAATIRYRDEFERIVESGTQTGQESVVNPLVSTITGVQGVQINGMFTLDGYTQQYPVTPATSGSNLDLLRRSMFWTTPPASGSTPSTASANDYITFDINPDNTGANMPSDVMRSMVFLRPSTQEYNHHRKIEFKPGAESASLSVITYEIGIELRGYFDGWNNQGACCWISYTTNGNGTITYAEVVVGYRNVAYDVQFPSTSASYATVVARKKYASGAASGFPNLYDGSWHSLAFQATTYAGGLSPETAVLYNVQLDGSPLELNDSTAPFLSSTVSPYTIIEPGPAVVRGRSEGIWWLASSPDMVSSTRAFTPPAFRNWTEETLVADPGPTITDADAMASIAVTGEGTPSGTLNLSGGALSISGAGVWDVNANVGVESVYPLREVYFDSGHKYTSPLVAKPRRKWRVSITSMDLTIYQSLLSFFNSHNGIEVPFTFRVPITADGTESSITAGSLEDVYGWFVDDELLVTQTTYQTYDVAFSIEELLVS